jgi:hypothetical protein
VKCCTDTGEEELEMAQVLALFSMNQTVDYQDKVESDIEKVKLPLVRLDHTQRPRLFNMRQRLMNKTPADNFLTILLRKNSPLIRERIVRRKGMMHWFLRGEDDYVNQVRPEQSSINSVIIDHLSKSRDEEVLREYSRPFTLQLAAG